MIISAIFIETFFSTCGACAPADAVNASESIAMARNLADILSERSSWRDLRLQHHSDLDISPSPLGTINYLRNLTFVQANGRQRRCHGRMTLAASGHVTLEPPSNDMSRRRVHSITSLARARSRRWDFDAQTLGGLQIDDQFEFRRQRDWQVGWLLALENPAGVDTNLSIRIREAPTIAHQTASRDELTQRVNSRQCVARRRRN